RVDPGGRPVAAGARRRSVRGGAGPVAVRRMGVGVTAGDVLQDKRVAARRLLAGVAGPVPDAYERHVNPRLAGLLHGLGLDVTFVRGQGTRLYDAAGLSYLDFAGAYGALPFGHNPPEIWQAVEAVRQDAEPSLIQPAPLAAAGELAERLVQLAPGDLTYAFFCNSGAEAVEAALKVARAATGRLL